MVKKNQVLRNKSNPDRIAIVTSEEVGKHFGRCGNNDGQFEAVTRDEKNYCEKHLLMTDRHKELRDNDDELWEETDIVLSDLAENIEQISWQELKDLLFTGKPPRTPTIDAETFVQCCEAQSMFLTNEFFKVSAPDFRIISIGIYRQILNAWLFWKFSEEQQERLREVIRKATKFGF